MGWRQETTIPIDATVGEVAYDLVALGVAIHNGTYA